MPFHNQMIQEIKLGEIISFKEREWVLTETAIGGSDKKRPMLVILSNLIQGNKRKGANKKQRYFKKIRGIKLKIQ